MNNTPVKFATQVDPDVLIAVKGLAKKEGRKIQALIDEALVDLLSKRNNTTARPHVMQAYMQSHESYAAVYKKLAE